jgi:hypothetical protein
VESESYDESSGDNPALISRLEALIERASSGGDGPELPVGPVLAASLTGLRAELSGLRSDLAAS